MLVVEDILTRTAIDLKREESELNSIPYHQRPLLLSCTRITNKANSADVAQYTNDSIASADVADEILVR